MDYKLREEKIAHCTIYITCYERPGLLFSFSPEFIFIISQNCLKFAFALTHHLQSSDAEMLKQAFTYARQQAWGSPNVLQLVDRCNKAGVVENWCMVGLVNQKFMK